MLTKTSVTALRMLVYVARGQNGNPVAPAEAASTLGASLTYLSKINTELAKAGILITHRGTKGGVTLARPPEQISLLDVVEACQGRILGDYCAPHDDLSQVCAFHHAMHELQSQIIAVLSKWTLADMIRRPLPIEPLRGKVQCRMDRGGDNGDQASISSSAPSSASHSESDPTVMRRASSSRRTLK
jgi:Rrf2 family protein